MLVLDLAFWYFSLESPSNFWHPLEIAVEAL